MEKITSFQVDHLRLKPGLFESRKDKFENLVLTTFDIRFKEPNREPVLDPPVIHTIEHLCATFLRSHKEWGSKIVYFGPMGCRTGFYLILEGNLNPKNILPLIQEMLGWIDKFDKPIPGATAEECGNWREQNIDMAKYECRKYASLMRNPSGENLEYPSAMV